MLCAALFAVACGDPRPPVGEVGAIPGFFGGVAADEPHAAVVARDILSSGGTPADAVTAAYLTMVVTYPFGVGLGGGGICVTYDPKTNEALTLEFLPQEPAAGGPVAVPGALRGMAALHARYGRLRWSQLVATAETQARFGHDISRALATRIAASADRLANDPAARALLFTSDGKPRMEGDRLTQVELASVLTQVRSRGAGDFYGGQAGRSFVAAVAAMGGRVTLEDLRAYRATWRETRTQPVGNHTLHSALPPPQGGDIVYELLRDLAPEGRAADPAALLEATAKAYGDVSVDISETTGDAAVVAGSRTGAAVACTFTMGAPFGTATIARSTGIFTASADRARMEYPAPALLVNQNTEHAFLAIAASGGAAAPMAVARTVRRVLSGRSSMAGAIAEPRLMRLGAGGPVLHEPGIEPGSLAQTGLARADVRSVAALGSVQALWCADGLKYNQVICEFVSDGRGAGLALGQGF